MKVRYTLAVIIFVLSVCLTNFVCAQQQYHVDPNSIQGLIPGKLIEGAKNILRVQNERSQEFNVLISDNDKDWTIATIGKLSSVEYSKPIYLKIYTTEEKYKYYKLALGYRYLIKWDQEKGLWYLQ